MILPNGACPTAPLPILLPEGRKSHQSKSDIGVGLSKAESVMEEPVLLLTYQFIRRQVPSTLPCVVLLKRGFWPIQWALMATIKEDLDAAGIEIPYPSSGNQNRIRKWYLAPSLISLRQQPNFFHENDDYFTILAGFWYFIIFTSIQSGDFFEDGSVHFVPEQCSATRNLRTMFDPGIELSPTKQNCF